MRYRRLTEDYDYTFGANQQDFFRDDPIGVAQAVETRLRLWAGEWFLDIVEGTPYQVGALGKHTMKTIEPLIRERVLNTEGVTAITSYQGLFDPDTRTYTALISIDTLYGPATVTGVL